MILDYHYTPVRPNVFSSRQAVTVQRPIQASKDRFKSVTATVLVKEVAQQSKPVEVRQVRTRLVVRPSRTPFTPPTCTLRVEIPTEPLAYGKLNTTLYYILYGNKIDINSRDKKVYGDGSQTHGRKPRSNDFDRNKPNFQWKPEHEGTVLETIERETSIN